MAEFKTKANRLVYDGSGIYPDIVLEPKKYSTISSALTAKNLIFDYATKYRVSHPVINSAKEFKLSDTEYDDFVQYVLSKEFDYTTKTEKALEDFKETAEKEKYFENIKQEFEMLKKKTSHNKQEDLKQFKFEIKELLEQEIASRYFYQTGKLETSFDTDLELARAIYIFRNLSIYSAILKGEGEYKIIGKPKPTKK
jgi:carboxyl-terminal processing protease